MPTSARPAAQKVFDYTSLDSETSQFVQEQTGEIRVLMKRTVESIVEIGKKLIEVKKRLKHGRFGIWLLTEFYWDERTARRFMSVAESLGHKSDILSKANFAPSALYLLAAPSTPETARAEALARAEAGEAITVTVAKEIKRKHPRTVAKPEPEPEPESLSQSEPFKLPPEPASQPQATPPIAPYSLSSKLEIVAIHHQTQALPLESATRLVVPQSLQTPLASQPLVEQPGVWWELGGKHLLYCGDPNSSEFVGRVTQEVELVRLLLAFPSTLDWQPVLRAKARLIVDDYLPQGKNPEQLDEILEAALLFYSRPQDIVVSCFLPSLEVLSVVNRHGRRVLFAEPNERRCKQVITDWKRAGIKTERLN